MRVRQELLQLLATTVFTFVSAPAFAQEAARPASSVGQSSGARPSSSADNTLEEIVVTAQKRTESVQDVPISISVVGRDQLDRQQVNEVKDLRSVVPSLEVSDTGQSPGSGAFIRGLGTTVASPTAEASVGVVIDGVPQGNAPQLDVFDVARVEVLRGPQGTLFGQGVSAGLLNIATNTPRIGLFEGYAQTELAFDGVAGSEFGKKIVRGVVNIPIGNTAALRLAAHGDWLTDITHNNYTHQASDEKHGGLRGRLLVQPNTAVTINIIGDYNQVDASQPPFFTYYSTTSSLLTSVLAGCGITPSAGNANICTSVPQANRQANYGLSGQVDIALGDFKLTSITAYRRDDLKQLSSVDGLPPAAPLPHVTSGPNNNDKKLFSQEIRLTSPSSGPLEYVVGAFYTKYDGYYDFGGLVVAGPFTIPSDTVRLSNIETTAGFGQATWHVTDRFRLFAGGRLTQNRVAAANHNRIPAVIVVGAESTVRDFSWKAGGELNVADRTMLYATVSRGFKGQTYNDSPLTATPPLVQAERPLAVEVGVKGSLLDRKLNYDVNLFDTRVTNYQAQVCVGDPTRGINCTAQNIANLTSKGFEANLFGRPIAGLSVDSGLAYVDAVYPHGFLGTDGVDLGGQEVINVSKWKLTESSEYEAKVNDRIRGFIGVDAVWRSRMRYSAASNQALTFGAHWIVGGRLGLRDSKTGVEVALFARNLFNVHEPVLRFSSIIGPSFTQILGENSFRTVGVSARLQF